MSYSYNVTDHPDTVVNSLANAGKLAIDDAREFEGTKAAMRDHLGIALEATRRFVNDFAKDGYNEVTVTVNGHANIGHGPTEGGAADELSISVKGAVVDPPPDGETEPEAAPEPEPEPEPEPKKKHRRHE